MKLETENASSEGRKTHAWQMAVAAALCMVLAVLLVLPGFLAAWFSKGDSFVYSLGGDVLWKEWDFSENMDEVTQGGRMKIYLLVPSGWVMRHSQAAIRFYSWEYNFAGGRTMVAD